MPFISDSPTLHIDDLGDNSDGGDNQCPDEALDFHLSDGEGVIEGYYPLYRGY